MGRAKETNHGGKTIQVTLSTALISPFGSLFALQKISGSKIIEFQQAFSVVTRPYFFSSAFGPVESREECTKSSEMLFRRLLRLMAQKDEEYVNFYHICNWMYRGCTTPEEKANAAEYLKLFEAKEDGKVYLVDFVVAIDKIYKRLRFVLVQKDKNNLTKMYSESSLVFFFQLPGFLKMQSRILRMLTRHMKLSSMSSSILLGAWQLCHYLDLMCWSSLLVFLPLWFHLVS